MYRPEQVVVPDGVEEGEVFQVAIELGADESAVEAELDTAEPEEAQAVQEAEQAERDLMKMWASDEERQVEAPQLAPEAAAAEPEPEPERIAAEEAEQARVAAEKAEQERIAAEEAEQAEQARVAAEKAEQERIAAEESEQARVPAQKRQPQPELEPEPELKPEITSNRMSKRSDGGRSRKRYSVALAPGALDDFVALIDVQETVKEEEEVDEASEPVTSLQVVCPEGVGPGDALYVQTPDGQEITTAVPEGVRPGDEFQVDLGSLQEEPIPGQQMQEIPEPVPSQPTVTQRELPTTATEVVQTNIDMQSPLVLQLKACRSELAAEKERSKTAEATMLKVKKQHDMLKRTLEADQAKHTREAGEQKQRLASETARADAMEARVESLVAASNGSSASGAALAKKDSELAALRASTAAALSEAQQEAASMKAQLQAQRDQIAEQQQELEEAAARAAELEAAAAADSDAPVAAEDTPPLPAAAAVRGGGNGAGKRLTQPQFRRYLEKSRVADVVEEILKGLLAQETKPKSPLQFLQENEGLFTHMIASGKWD